ncbi:MAG TPA: hypothetical protein ENH82_17840 [bacterium]|nr:hypothetical protein [bacterium]
MSIRAFLKRHWVTVILAIITIVASYVIGCYFYKKSTSPPEPVFLVDPVKTSIIDSSHIAETPLRVVRKNGNEIKGDITSIRFYFWNNGRKSIKPSNILEPLVVTLDDPKGEILDYKILKCSRKVVKPVVERNSFDPNKSLSLSFAILEQEDGLTCQVIYVGNPDAGLMISGIIENARKIITTTELIHSYIFKNIGKIIAISILAWLTFLIRFMINYHHLSKTKPKLTVRNKIKKMSRRIVITVFMFVVFFSLGHTAFKQAKEKASIAVIQEVPKDIVP